MLDPNWVYFSAVLGLLGGCHYSWAIVNRRARPNLVTWSMWAAAPLIGFFAQLDAGVGLPAVPTLGIGLGPLIVVVTALLARRHRARLGLFDLTCAVVATTALGVWLGLGQAPIAVFFAVLADGVAALPTVLKAWRDPDSENLIFYVSVGIGGVITLLTVSVWKPTVWAFAAYILSLSVLLVTIVTTRRAWLSRAVVDSTAQRG